jgi:hypothetical protein
VPEPEKTLRERALNAADNRKAAHQRNAMKLLRRILSVTTSPADWRTDNTGRTRVTHQGITFVVKDGGRFIDQLFVERPDNGDLEEVTSLAQLGELIADWEDVMKSDHFKMTEERRS